MDMFRFKPVIMMVADMPNRGITVLPARPARPWTQAECIHRKQPLLAIVPCGHDEIPFGILPFGETNIPPGTRSPRFSICKPFVRKRGADGDHAAALRVCPSSPDSLLPHGEKGEGAS